MNGNIYKNNITLDEAKTLFDNDLIKYEEEVAKTIKVNISQNQFDVLVIFCYNIGASGFNKSSVAKIINGEKTNYSSLEEAWKSWNKSNGVVNNGLKNRRNSEYKIYTEGIYERW